MDSMDINLRQNQLTCLHNYLKDVDTEVTMILQNLQWDRKHLVEEKPMVACQYDKGHRVPPDKLMEHENKCFLKSQGYADGDRLLPSPIDPSTTTLVKLNGDNIAEIIRNAAYCQPAFSTGAGCGGHQRHQPLTLERLQATFTADERRAIHDAVVNQVPSCHDLSDLALLSTNNEGGATSKPKSKMEILAELRDMRRRRAKYRVPAKTRNYSDVLRDVITTQMELYTQANTSINEMKSSDTENNIKAFNSPKEKNTSTITKDMHNPSQYVRQHEEYQTKKRRYNESDLDYNSLSEASKTGHHGDRDDVKSKRKDDGYYSSKGRRESHRRHDRYDSRNKYREREYNRKGNTRTEQQENNRSDERHLNKRKDQDKHGKTKFSTYDIDREKRYEREVHKVTIKKEKDDCGDDSNSSEDNETENTDIISSGHELNSGMRKIKIKKEVNLNKEENSVSDDRSKDRGSKSSDTFIKYPSRIVHDRQSDSSIDNYQKNEGRTNYTDIQEERTTPAIQKIKLENDITEYHKRDEGNKRYKNRRERYRDRDDKYRSDKRKEKEKTYRKH